MFWPSTSPRIPAGFQLMRASKRPQSKTTMPSMCPGAPGIRISCEPAQPYCPSFKNFRRQANPWARCATARGSFLIAKLTKGRMATGYWPIMEDMANAGATVLDQPVVVDENVITSRFIYDIPQFFDAIVTQLN